MPRFKLLEVFDCETRKGILRLADTAFVIQEVRDLNSSSVDEPFEIVLAHGTESMHTHDLEALAQPLFLATFAGDFLERPRPALTWGRRCRSSSRRSLRLGPLGSSAPR